MYVKGSCAYALLYKQSHPDLLGFLCIVVKADGR